MMFFILIPNNYKITYISEALTLIINAALNFK